MLTAFMCAAVMNVSVQIVELDSGQYNHLLRADSIHFNSCDPKTTPVDLSQASYAMISYSSPVKLGEVGEVGGVRIWGECLHAYGVDEDASDRYNSWITFRLWICTANKLEVL